jgi:predicted MFS family arabinose efflux permease
MVAAAPDTAAAPDDGPGPRWGRQAAIAGAGIFVGSYDLGAISDAMGPVAHQWHLSTAVVSTLGTSTLVGMLVGSLVTGVLADRLGRRRLIVADIVLFVVSSVLGALAPDFGVLTAARLATGVAIGTEFAVVFPFVAEVAPSDRRGRSMAWIMWAANFGVLTAYGLGALLLAADPAGWRVTLGLGAVLALPIVAFRSTLAESASWRQQRLPSVASIVRGIVGRDRRRHLVTGSAATFLYQIGDQGITLVLPLLLATALGAGAAGGAAGATAVKAVTIPAALLTVVGIERLGRRFLQVIGFAGRALAFGALGVLLVVFGHVSGWLVGVLLGAGFFFGAAGPDKTTVIVPAETFASGTRGSGQGVAQATGRLGGIVGVTCYGLLASLGGPGAGLLLFAGAALLGTVVSLAVPGRAQGRPSTALWSADSAGVDGRAAGPGTGAGSGDGAGSGAGASSGVGPGAGAGSEDLAGSAGRAGTTSGAASEAGPS